MGVAAKYWRLVRIDTAGKSKTEEIAPARAFFQQQFPSPPLNYLDVPDALIQRQLWHHWQNLRNSASDASQCPMAELCLRCFISNQIQRACVQLEAQFGGNHGFTREDLFSRVLDDDGRQHPEPKDSVSPIYQPLAVKILQNFDPKRGSLATWTTRLVKHHPDLNNFLLEHGVYLVSDWAILNDTNPRQLQRILAEFYYLTPVEVRQAACLLESYHAIYRRDRLKQRQSQSKRQCKPPTDTQLDQIAHLLQAKATITLSTKNVMNRLQDMAERLRQYRIYVRGGVVPTESLDRPERRSLADLMQSAHPLDDLEQDDRTEFLRFYRQQFRDCLAQAVEQVIQERVLALQRKQPPQAQQFLTALQLFHCHGQSMGEIASLLGWQRQDQVSRLLKLKNFRADIRQQMLKALLDRILDRARIYVSPDRLQSLDLQIDAALDEQIGAVIQEAKAEAMTATSKNAPLSSLFAQRLCQYLDARRNQP